MEARTASVKRIELERRRQYGVWVEDMRAMVAMRWQEPQRAIERDALEHRLIHDVYVEPLQHAVVTYPADWWQAFKERWFPRWALKRWPARMMRVEMDAAAYVPEMRGMGRYHHVAVLDVQGPWMLPVSEVE